jgi:hypothetical protein
MGEVAARKAHDEQQVVRSGFHVCFAHIVDRYWFFFQEFKGYELAKVFKGVR